MHVARVIGFTHNGLSTFALGVRFASTSAKAAPQLSAYGDWAIGPTLRARPTDASGAALPRLCVLNRQIKHIPCRSDAPHRSITALSVAGRSFTRWRNQKQKNRYRDQRMKNFAGWSICESWTSTCSRKENGRKNSILVSALSADSKIRKAINYLIGH